MGLPLEALESELMGLPPSDRVRLLDRLVASLDADKRRDAAWDAVAAQREASAAADPSLLVPIDEALARLRSELA